VPQMSQMMFHQGMIDNNAMWHGFSTNDSKSVSALFHNLRPMQAVTVSSNIIFWLIKRA
jgi:hypothetical protein